MRSTTDFIIEMNIEFPFDDIKVKRLDYTYPWNVVVIPGGNMLMLK